MEYRMKIAEYIVKAPVMRPDMLLLGKLVNLPFYWLMEGYRGRRGEEETGVALNGEFWAPREHIKEEVRIFGCTSDDHQKRTSGVHAGALMERR